MTKKVKINELEMINGIVAHYFQEQANLIKNTDKSVIEIMFTSGFNNISDIDISLPVNFNEKEKILLAKNGSKTLKDLISSNITYKIGNLGDKPSLSVIFTDKPLIKTLLENAESKSPTTYELIEKNLRLKFIEIAKVYYEKFNDYPPDHFFNAIHYNLSQASENLTILDKTKTKKEIENDLRDKYSTRCLNIAKFAFNFLKTSFEWDRDYDPRKVLIECLRMAAAGPEEDKNKDKSKTLFERMDARKALLRKTKVDFRLLVPECTKSNDEMRVEFNKACNLYSARVDYLMVINKRTFWIENATKAIDDRLKDIDKKLELSDCDYSALDPEEKKTNDQMKTWLNELCNKHKKIRHQDILEKLSENFNQLKFKVCDPDSIKKKTQKQLAEIKADYTALDPNGKRSNKEMKTEFNLAYNIALLRQKALSLSFINDKSYDADKALTEIEMGLKRFGFDFSALDPDGRKTHTEIEKDLKKEVYRIKFGIDFDECKLLRE